ncbi:MAG: hypothetical protein M3281_01015 [Chloroflexota bacterium]|nr:hypothetical protein [Chloroflexota bacterium]
MSKRLRTAALALLCVVAVASGSTLLYGVATRESGPPATDVNGVRLSFAVRDGHLAQYDGRAWRPRFWTGVNLGATTPGHFPGELAPTREDYLRWFASMKRMNADVVRIYTILPPHFYAALEEFNSGREDPLLLLHGIWSPEDELVGNDGKGRDAYAPAVKSAFEQEIRDAVHVIHGDAKLPPRRGHASGEYKADISRYVLGWIVGTEWHPLAVAVTDRLHPRQRPYSGTYFRTRAGASAFESWLARMLDVVATEEMGYRSQRPVAFTNWLTTDPLRHPNEPLEQEDMVTVDPMHVAPADAWAGGYFASYHVYPYYPDFLRYSPEYRDYRGSDGQADPYAGYLHDLRRHHKGVPVVVAEYGVPSSRGKAHLGPAGRDQGMHTETEQGRIDASMLKAIHDEGYDGALLFSWQDEWFKYTWNTRELELPADRRAYWHNVLTNEENYGVLALEPGKSEADKILLDGKVDDWDRRTVRAVRRYRDFDLSVSHDEAFVYLLLRKHTGSWAIGNGQEVSVGFGTLDGGSTRAGPVPGLTFPGGVQVLLRLTGREGSRLLINSAYDPHTWTYVHTLKMLRESQPSPDAKAGQFLPWRLAVSRPLYLPATRQHVPFEEIEVGRMRFGKTDPQSAAYDSLADWYAERDVLEVRVPWMLLGFTDPSSLQVWNYPYKVSRLEPVGVDGIRVYPAVRWPAEASPQEVEPLKYTWQRWDLPAYHEREKQSYAILRDAFARYRALPPSR